MAEPMSCVVMLASGASWEAPALSLLSATKGVVVLKRCLDVDDLMASVTSGQCDVAVLALEAPGLDAAAITHLRRHGVRPIAVAADLARDDVQARLGRLDIPSFVSASAIDTLPQILADPEPGQLDHDEPPASDWAALNGGTRPRRHDSPDVAAPGGHRVIAVWGAAGAPGRTTVASAVAGELSLRQPTLLIDADPWAPSVAQHLGILDETSGLLSAARLSQSGQLAPRFGSVVRGLHPGLGVITGLPRADRWIEVREGDTSHLIELARGYSNVVLDTGFSLEADRAPDLGSLPGRNTITLEAITAADEILVVASADPVGLARVARGLVELREFTGGRPVSVVINRMRKSLGWAESDLASLVQSFASITALHFLPDDQAAVDRALVAGRGVVESGTGELARQLPALVDALVPDSVASAPRRGRRRRG